MFDVRFPYQRQDGETYHIGEQQSSSELPIDHGVQIRPPVISETTITLQGFWPNRHVLRNQRLKIDDASTADQHLDKAEEIIGTLKHVQLELFGLNPDENLEAGRISQAEKLSFSNLRPLYFVQLPQSLSRDQPRPKAPELPLSGEFIPSDDLLAVWVRGLNSRVAELMVDKPEAKFYSVFGDHKLLQSNFVENLDSTLAQHALVRSYIQKDDRLTVGGNFMKSFERRAYAEFLFSPSDGHLFFAHLLADLKNWLSLGRTYNRSWGKIETDGKDLVLRLKRSRRKPKGKFTKATFE